MDKLVADKLVTCEPLNFGRFGRVIATCSVEGRDISEAMLEMGQAVTYRKYLAGSPVEARYLAAERKAESARLGVWADDQ
jgi:endonuclease YncB( thermonuclease family)